MLVGIVFVAGMMTVKLVESEKCVVGISTAAISVSVKFCYFYSLVMPELDLVVWAMIPLVEMLVVGLDLCEKTCDAVMRC